MKTTRPSKKLDHQKVGPNLIVKQINVVVFQLKLLGSMKIHLVFHVSLLEHYHAGSNFLRCTKKTCHNMTLLSSFSILFISFFS